MTSAPDIVVRKATAADIGTIYRTDQLCFPPGISFDEDSFFIYLNDPSSINLVAELEEEMAGFVILRRYSKSRANLVTIDVTPRLQGCGIGTSLMDEAERMAKKSGIDMIVLQVAVDNERAMEFYTRRGYARARRLRNYYQNGVDAWEMRLSI